MKADPNCVWCSGAGRLEGETGEVSWLCSCTSVAQPTLLTGSLPAEREKLRADRAVAELQAFKEAVLLCMGTSAKDAMPALERITAALLARGGF